MPRFSYKARDSGGHAVEASIDASTRRDAVRLLSARGLSVAALAEVGGAPAPARGAKATPAAPRAEPLLRLGADNAPRRAERLPFLESLHDLTTSGLSAGEAVRLLSIRIREPRQRALCEGLWSRLSEGAPLSRAMEAYPSVFDTSSINLIHAGEATGSLNDTLARLIEHLNEQREMRQKIMAAMSYPALLIVVSGGVILFFILFLLPRVQSLLHSLGGQMPVSTRALIGFAYLVTHFGVFGLIALVAVAASVWKWRETEAGRLTCDAWLLKVPVVGPFLVSKTVLEFSQTLGVLLQNGITASDALRMTERQIDNRVHRKAFDGAIERVLEGESLSSALMKTGCFPELVLDRLAIGENTGNMVPSLREIAKGYQKLISRQLNLFVQVIAGGILGGVFVFVGFIAFSIVMAVLQVSNSIRLG